MTFEQSLLERIGFKGVEHVRAEIGKTRQLTPEEVRRAAVKIIRKGSTGRGGLPEYAVATMYADYQRLHSLSKVGKIYGRTRQSVYDTFRSHGYQLEARNFRQRIIWRDRVFTPGKNGYYRETSGEREPLHHAIWRHHHPGPIPDGCQVSFVNGNKLDAQIGNLFCAPIDEVTRYQQARLKTERLSREAAKAAKDRELEISDRKLWRRKKA